MLDRMKGPVLKTRDELAIMDRANRIVLELLEMMRELVKPGATTAQINAMAEEELAKRGAKSPFKGYAPMGLPPYPAVVCASVNDVIVHGIPSRTKLREGDIIPACAQTCPADAIVFGDLHDPSSRVSRLARDNRAFHVLEELNTRPAISYLKRVAPDGAVAAGG